MRFPEISLPRDLATFWDAAGEWLTSKMTLVFAATPVVVAAADLPTLVVLPLAAVSCVGLLGWGALHGRVVWRKARVRSLRRDVEERTRWLEQAMREADEAIVDPGVRAALEDAPFTAGGLPLLRCFGPWKRTIETEVLRVEEVGFAELETLRVINGLAFAALTEARSLARRGNDRQTVANSLQFILRAGAALDRTMDAMLELQNEFQGQSANTQKERTKEYLQRMEAHAAELEAVRQRLAALPPAEID